MFAKSFCIAAAIAFGAVVGGPVAANRLAVAQQIAYRFHYEFRVYRPDNDLIKAETHAITARSGAEAELFAGQLGNNLLGKYAPGQQGAYCRRRLLQVE